MWSLLIGAVLACVAIIKLLNHKDSVDLMYGWALSFLGGILMMSYLVPAYTDQYYLPAEIAVQTEWNTYFVADDGKVFISEKEEWHSPDSPYLLCMCTMGTHIQDDDEVLVVWRTK